MANKYQRRVNKSVRAMNKGFDADIYPYNLYTIRQFKAHEFRDSPYESLYLLHLYKAGELVSTHWLDYLEIVGVGNQVLGRQFFWWVNNEVVRTK